MQINQGLLEEQPYELLKQDAGMTYEDQNDQIAKEVFKREDEESGSISGKSVSRFISQMGGWVVMLIIYVMSQASGITEQLTYRYL